MCIFFIQPSTQLLCCFHVSNTNEQRNSSSLMEENLCSRTVWGVRKCKSVVSSDINFTGNERPRCLHSWWRICLYEILIFSSFQSRLWHSNDRTGSYNFLITRLDKSSFTIRLNTDYPWAKEATLGLSPRVLKWTFDPENEAVGDLFFLSLCLKNTSGSLCIFIAYQLFACKRTSNYESFKANLPLRTALGGSYCSSRHNHSVSGAHCHFLMQNLSSSWCICSIYFPRGRLCS